MRATNHSVVSAKYGILGGLGPLDLSKNLVILNSHPKQQTLNPRQPEVQTLVPELF